MLLQTFLKMWSYLLFTSLSLVWIQSSCDLYQQGLSVSLLVVMNFPSHLSDRWKQSMTSCDLINTGCTNPIHQFFLLHTRTWRWLVFINFHNIIRNRYKRFGSAENSRYEQLWHKCKDGFSIPRTHTHVCHHTHAGHRWLPLSPRREQTVTLRVWVWSRYFMQTVCVWGCV